VGLPYYLLGALMLVAFSLVHRRFVGTLPFSFSHRLLDLLPLVSVPYLGPPRCAKEAR